MPKYQTTPAFFGTYLYFFEAKNVQPRCIYSLKTCKSNKPLSHADTSYPYFIYYYKEWSCHSFTHDFIKQLRYPPQRHAQKA